MYVKRVVLFVLLYLDICSSIRIWRHKTSCGRPGSGFTCLPKLGITKTVIIECPTRREYHIYINEFNGPRTLENLIIKNCKTLTVLFRCSKYVSEKKNMKYLEISNVETLKFQNAALYQSLLPPNVVIQNIGRIDRIPSNTFTQTNIKANIIRCALPNYNVNSIHFNNVSIGTIQTKAFNLPNRFEHLKFTNVRINTLETSSIIINRNRSGTLLFEGSTIGIIKLLAIQVITEDAIFTKNKFRDMSTMGIQISSNKFNFTDNVVDNLHRHGFTVDSHDVLISSNFFKHLKARAFSRLGGTENRLGHCKFVGNVINFIEDGGLLPRLYTYKNISAQIAFERNIFSCDCYQSGLLLSEVGKKSDYPPEDEFYQKVFNSRFENLCSSTCKLPLHFALAKIVYGKCTNKVTTADLCAAKKQAEATKYTTDLATTFVESSTPSTIHSIMQTVPYSTTKLKIQATTTLSSHRVITETSTEDLWRKYKIPSTNYWRPPTATSFISTMDDLPVPTTRQKLSKDKWKQYNTPYTNYWRPPTATSFISTMDDLPVPTTRQKLPKDKFSTAVYNTMDLFTVTSAEVATSSISSLETFSNHIEETTWVGSTEDKLTTSTASPTNDDTSSSSLQTILPTFLQTSTDANLLTKVILTTTDVPTEEHISSSSICDTCITTNEDLGTRLTTDASLLKLRQHLTTATVLVTTVPTTKYKPPSPTEKVTLEYTDDDGKTIIPDVSTFTPGQTSKGYDKEYVVTDSRVSDKMVMQNSATVYFWPSQLLFIFLSLLISF